MIEKVDNISKISNIAIVDSHKEQSMQVDNRGNDFDDVVSLRTPTISTDSIGRVTGTFNMTINDNKYYISFINGAFMFNGGTSDVLSVNIKKKKVTYY